MSEHKYKDAYKKGYEKGKQEAFTGYCMECYDELSWYEQAKLMVEWGADIPNILDKIRVEIEHIEISGQIDEHSAFIRNGEQVRQVALDIIDKYRKEQTDADSD